MPVLADIIIITDNNAFGEILKSEAERVGHKAVVAKSLKKTDLMDYRLAVIDIDALNEQIPNLDNIVAIGYSKLSYQYLERHYQKDFEALFHKPFLISEYRIKVEELLDDENNFLKISKRNNNIALSLDEKSKSLFCNKKEIKLSETEYLIFSTLFNNYGKTVSREELAEVIGSPDNPKEVDVYICFLRRKIDEQLNIRLIKTVRGKGYTIINR